MNNDKNQVLSLIATSVQLLVCTICLLLFIDSQNKELIKHINYNKEIKPSTITTIDNGDIWYSIGDSTNKIEWRHIKNSNDSMSVIHIHQGNSLFTWIGKPCNCY